MFGILQEGKQSDIVFHQLDPSWYRGWTGLRTEKETRSRNGIEVRILGKKARTTIRTCFLRLASFGVPVAAETQRYPDTQSQDQTFFEKGVCYQNEQTEEEEPKLKVVGDMSCSIWVSAERVPPSTARQACSAGDHGSRPAPVSLLSPAQQSHHVVHCRISFVTGSLSLSKVEKADLVFFRLHKLDRTR